VNKTPQILIVSKDPSIREEVEKALGGAVQIRTSSHYASTFREGVEIAENRGPDLVFADFGLDIDALAAFVNELDAVAPQALVAALYRPDAFDSQSQENRFLIDAVRTRVSDIVRRPVSSTDVRDLMLRMRMRSPARRGAALGKVIAFVSNKGGVGKSTLATNTACAVAEGRPDRVLLIDASLQLGVCSSLLDLTDAPTLVDVVRERHRLDETLLRQLAAPHESGVRLIAAPRDAVEASDIDEESLTRVLTLARRTFDYVVVDTFPMLDATVMTVLDLSDLAFVVLQGTVPDVVGTARLVGVLDRLGIPDARRRIVVNRNYPNFSGVVGLDAIEERLGEEVSYAFPYQKGVLSAQNLGRPYIGRAPRFLRYARTLRALADEITGLDAIGVRAPHRGAGGPAQ